MHRVLRVTDPAKKQFAGVFETAIPVANVLYDAMTNEGYLDGMAS
ncbi:hypothetical protein [Dyadobacter fermentans]|nr:hypothetical protein [Dyadobacter fermentans]